MTYILRNGTLIEQRTKWVVRLCVAIPLTLIAAYIFLQGLFFVFDKGVEIYFNHYNEHKCRCK